ncbi:MAG TPA: PilZ domain-containing protein [Anaeromyxobacteraceae bacterium]|nr:PilZ domain-containing protein [Anaeromyxobacteraceae bacterium]
MDEGDDPARERERSDRRDSRRVRIRLMVRDAALGGSFDEREGNLSLGGVYFAEGHPPFGTRVEVRFLLPGQKREVRAVGDILRVSREPGGFGAHVRFEDLPLEDELAIAWFLEREP